MDKTSTDSNALIKYGLTALLAGFLIFYVWNFLKGYSLVEAPFLVWVFLALVVGFIFAGVYLSRFKKLYAVMCFAALLCIYSFRVLWDIYTSYLWCEDGLILIQDAILKGPAALFDHSAGYCWFLPKLVSLLCYWVCLLFNDITFLPELQGAVCKIIAVASLMYFMSDRFEWLVKSLVWRFAICVIVVISIPMTAYDTVPVDTSLPFIMNFTAFLIGLDCLFGPKARPVTVFETIFLSLLAMSTASAPFCAAVAVFALGRWLWDKSEKKEHVAIGIACTAVVTACALFQTITLLLSPREISDLSFARRLFVCVNDFVFFPYLASYRSVLVWLIGLAGWLAAAFLAKTSWKIMLYSSVYAYGFLFYCSMLGDPDFITEVISSGVAPRYYVMNYMIAFFLLGVHIYRLVQADKARRITGAALCLVIFIIAVPTYIIGLPNPLLARAYDYGAELFEQDGPDKVIIPVAPTAPTAPTAHYRMVVPFDGPDFQGSSEDAEFEIEAIGDQDPSGTVLLSSEVTEYTIAGWAADRNGEPFDHVFYYWSQNQYEVPTSLVLREDVAEHFGCDRSDYGFLFDVDPGILSRGDLTFFGVTSDGEVYSWSISPDITVE
jgi:hypothetical protein